ncbi:MAG: GH3 auxin-responsive promoter family protein [Promethearchaeota archaeon]
MIWSLLSKILYRKTVKPFIKTLRDPVAAQDQRLHELLSHAAGTAYGKVHGFSDIRCFEEFVDHVPVNQYKDFQPYIQQELAGTSNMLYPEPIDVVMATSGTTGEPKLIPYTPFTWKSADRFRILYFFSADNIRQFFHGKMLAMVAPAVYKRIGNWDVGYLTGYGMKSSNRLFLRKIVPKTDVFDILDWETKFRETIRQAVETPDVTACIGITSFVMALLRRTKQESYSWLKNDPKLSNKARKRLEAAITDDGIIDLNELWPKLAVVFSSGVVKDLYGPVIQDMVGDVHIHEAYAGTEGTYAVQLYEDMQGVVPVVDDIYFEFAGECDGPLPPDTETIPLSDVKTGVPYRVIVTTPTGFWRYDVHDLVIFTSLNPPTLRCLGKSENTINLSGEKVSEGDISAALTMTCEEQDALVREFVIAPMVTIEGGTYHLFAEFGKSPANLELFTASFDRHLKSVNELYYHGRNAKTLLPAVIHSVPLGSFDAYERNRLQQNNKAIGQTKMPRITTYDQATEQLLLATVLIEA